MIDPSDLAFPRPGDLCGNGAVAGMTIRTWLVGQVLAGITTDYSNSAEGPRDTAKMAVAVADAVIAALNAEVSPTVTTQYKL